MRKKLKPELVGRSQEEVKQLRLSGQEVTDTYQVTPDTLQQPGHMSWSSSAVALSSTFSQSDHSMKGHGVRRCSADNWLSCCRSPIKLPLFCPVFAAGA